MNAIGREEGQRQEKRENILLSFWWERHIYIYREMKALQASGIQSKRGLISCDSSRTYSCFCFPSFSILFAPFSLFLFPFPALRSFLTVLLVALPPQWLTRGGAQRCETMSPRPTMSCPSAKATSSSCPNATLATGMLPLFTVHPCVIASLRYPLKRIANTSTLFPFYLVCERE